MRVLVLSSADRALDNHMLWSSLQDGAQVEVRFLDKDQQRRLRRYFVDITIDKYDRVILDLMFKHIRTQSRFLRTLPALTLYEEDAYLDFMPGSRWSGAFVRFYRRLPGVRVISTGFAVTNHLRAAGVDAHFVPKGFDPARMVLQNQKRDIELGFIGRLGSAAYSARRTLLETLAKVEPLEIMRTHTANEYVETLNRIHIFISADVGLSEYMAKNFEAMACGCLLLAKRQGRGEEEALGLEDDVNLLLYDDLTSLLERLEWAREHPGLARSIAVRGREHVLARNAYDKLAREINDVVSVPFTNVSSQPWWKFW
ncbi:glycosyltransferase family protein [Stutzerimonas xanthomarina]|uniref:glycosyltransferase family protein n=1 Tax=Stutzerimonas xanthomarina TaxID=271420 RepID=UPI003AA80447